MSMVTDLLRVWNRTAMKILLQGIWRTSELMQKSGTLHNLTPAPPHFTRQQANTDECSLVSVNLESVFVGAVL